ncbi:mycofactocin-coupled SDR family oxidoreductase [Amycolatopsis acidicola]|uniref:Mycofactocin-coupled SDR family oxidoreductase n=1 Tax=Amycolatopsis acidicola TaxID=2596893 RepID=A0A5N0UTZ0_9PSEU|nr:mycofactocin-coupled SDR family oxidoreductase [Amycolatopsis acidicola]KAA9153442.1 mycofactocin-coupled SDR family oxidoreductase [Amycolatopsis acidicola]
MTGRVEGKVAFITGAARGQGRAHAVRLAREGADIIAVDACTDVETVPYAMAGAEDLAETVRLVEKEGRKIVSKVADVRDQASLDAAVSAGVAEFGRLDIVCANAGVLSLESAWEMSEEQWLTTIDINLNGVWRTTKAAIPAMIEAGNGGSIILTSSTAYQKGVPHIANYVAAKHGVAGLMKTLANELGQHWIRVNSVAPTNVATPLILNDALMSTFVPDVENPTEDDAARVLTPFHILPEPWQQPSDVSNAVLFLASDEAKNITGTVLQVDLGFLAKY